MKTWIAVAALTAALTSCTSTSTSAAMGGPGTPGLPEAQYRIIGPATGSGKAMVISPGLAKLTGGQSAAKLAQENAVGRAIYDRDDVDMLIAVKMKATTTDVLGLFETAEVEIKGQAVQLTGPK